MYDVKNKEDFVEIDELLEYSIQILNLKGYYTRFCCSGHYGKSIVKEDSVNNGYIYFKNAHQFEKLPKGVYQDSSWTIRFTFMSKPNTRERYLELIQMSLNISDWVDELKTLGGEYTG